MLGIVDTIVLPDWMICADVLRVLDVLNDDLMEPGVEPLTLFVGGCVRNAALGREQTDIDLATKLTPDEVMDRCAAVNLKTIPTGIDYGTVTLVSGDITIEVTTLRKDVETDGRRAVVAFSKDWHEDALRRDFTMNTLLADAKGQVYDPLGCGLDDLKAGRVVFAGDPETRIAEDVLRILRFFRFYGAYGQGDPDPSAIAACAKMAHKIPDLSRERITQEFFKILQNDTPVNVLNLMFENKILKDVLSNKDNVGVLKKLCALQVMHQDNHLASRIFVLMGCDLNAQKRFEGFFLFSKRIKVSLKLLSQGCKLFISNNCDVHVLTYRVGKNAAIQSLIVQAARGVISEDQLSSMFRTIHAWSIPVFPVTGDDLIARGIPAGPELGAQLKELEDQWIASGFRDDFEALNA